MLNTHTTYLPVRFLWILPLIKCTIENWPIPDLLRTTLSGIAACSQAIGKCFTAQVAISCNVFPTENRLERLDFYHIRKRVFLWLPYTNVLVDEYPSMTAKIGEVFTGAPLTWSVFSAHWASIASSQKRWENAYDAKLVYLSDLQRLCPSRIGSIFAGSRKGHFVAILIASDGFPA